MNKITDPAVAGQPTVVTHRPLDQILKDRVEADRQIATAKAKRQALDREIEALAAAAADAMSQ